jgi:tRNA modification GTPase
LYELSPDGHTLGYSTIEAGGGCDRGTCGHTVRGEGPSVFAPVSVASGQTDVVTTVFAPADYDAVTSLGDLKGIDEQAMSAALDYGRWAIQDYNAGLATEAGIDFAEDDVAVLPSAQILAHISDICAPLEQLRHSFAYGKVVREGLTLAIVGRPNVGKSSLFNRLVERERAIVTAMPGTTRDLVTETVSIGGIPLYLVDTAGMRRARDEAESIGIRKSREALADADLVLVVVDSSQPLTSEDEELLRQVNGRRAIVVENKSDLGTVEGDAAGPKDGSVRTSALTGAGITELRAAILAHAGGEAGTGFEPALLTNARHQARVRDSLAALANAVSAVNHRVPHEMLLLDLYQALRPLDEITGATTTDDILNLIFSRFCIGK